MLWNIYTCSGMYCPTLIPMMVPMQTSTTSPELVNETKTNNPGQPKKIKSPILNLTKTDLERAGYDNRKKAWTQEEDGKLKELRLKQKLDWPEISNQIPGRNPKMCYNRYRRLENHTKNLWKNAENERICELVEEYGTHWKQISKHIEGRTSKQIKEHYFNFLKPDIKKEDWTIQEDMQLVSLMNQYGRNWKYLQMRLNGRTQNQIKNRYFGRLKKLTEKKALLGETLSESSSSSSFHS